MESVGGPIAVQARVRSMMAEEGVLTLFHALAAIVAVYFKNRTPMKALSKGAHIYGNATPCELWHRVRVHTNLSNLHVWGCVVYVYLNVAPMSMKKLDPRSQKCIFVRYTETDKL
jgi:hypothetical protein